MIRATMKCGAVVMLDPVPEDWADGEQLVIDRVPQMAASVDLDQWERQMEALAATIPADDFLTIDKALALADEDAKAIVRRSMGLCWVFC